MGEEGLTHFNVLSSYNYLSHVMIWVDVFLMKCRAVEVWNGKKWKYPCMALTGLLSLVFLLLQSPHSFLFNSSLSHSSPSVFLSLLLSPLPGVFSPGRFLSLFFGPQRHASMFPAPSQSVPAPIRLAATWQLGPASQRFLVWRCSTVGPLSLARPRAWGGGDLPG